VTCGKQRRTERWVASGHGDQVHRVAKIPLGELTEVDRTLAGRVFGHSLVHQVDWLYSTGACASGR
jgi:hypothetical protein